MRIRSKLLLLVTIPILAVMLTGIVGYRSQTGASTEAESAQLALAQASLVRDLTGRISVERLAYEGGTGIDLAAAAQATDLALDELSRSPLARSDRARDAIESTRSLVTEGRSGSGTGQSGDAYSIALRTISSVSTQIDPALPSSQALSQNLTSEQLVQFVKAKNRFWSTYLAATDPAELDLVALASDSSVSQQALSSSVDLDPELANSNRDSTAALTAFEATAIDDLAEGQLSVGREDVLVDLVSFNQGWASTIAEQDSAMIDGAAADASRITNLRSFFAGLAVIGGLVLAGLLFVLSNAINRPMSMLTKRANSVATVELPTLVESLREDGDSDALPEVLPIPKGSDDEIGELTDAFNEVQQTAYRLASEQAIGRRNVSDTFVNFGRRNQQLLQRMLTLLTELEQDEEDPESLESLFQLDNIVTRMRRNAESLLILAGSQTARQWTAPVPVADTVRAAIGEVEAYERIEIVTLPEVKIKGSAVADIAHLLAELLENALNFSENTKPVLVSGQFDKGGYLITIFDQGIGMSLDELAEVNERISNPPPLDRAPTRFLGLFVVGRLADRHSIKARVGEAPGNGLMARVHIPNEILVREDDPAIEEPQLAVEAGGDTSPLEDEIDIDAEWEDLSAEESTPILDSPPPPPALMGSGPLLPVRDKPLMVPPVVEAPTKDAPLMAPPVAEAPPVEAPIEDAPLMAPPMAEAPVVEAPPAEAPVVVSPLGEAPVVDAPDGPAPLPPAGLPVRSKPLMGASVPDATVAERPAPPVPEPLGSPAAGLGKPDLPVRQKAGGLLVPPLAAQEETDDDSEEDGIGASDFSSMMSALSSGISRGLSEPEPDSDDKGRAQ